MQLTIAHDIEALHGALLEPARAGSRVALVPTMGALHAGHVSLIERARQEAEIVVVSIFVNPTQFGEGEDFDRYPRTLEADCALAAEAGANIIYAPSAEDMYPQGFTTSISAGELSKELCGAFRPGHFDGVATVVSKLLLRVMPHIALFGKKDFQQLAIIKQVVRDLDIPTEIMGVPTLREKDGLALSSRNSYLTVQERIMAPKLHEILNQTAVLVKRTSIPDALAEGIVALTASGFQVDYLEFRDSDSLAPLATWEEKDGEARLLVAAWLGETRLIDNIAVR
jgi:pantoate--beta-alanine ligase